MSGASVQEEVIAEPVAEASERASDAGAAAEPASWTDGAGGSLGQLRGALGLVRDSIDGVTCLVRDVHLAIASQPFDVLAHAPVVSEGAAVVRPLYEGLAGAVYGSVRLVNRLVFAGLDGALAVADEQRRGEP